MQSHAALVPESGPTERHSLLTVIRAVIVWSVWTTATIGVLLYVRHCGRNLPMLEDLMFVPVMTGHPLDLKWVAAQQHEHRMVIPKLILAGLLRAIPDFRCGLYLNAAVMSAAAASMILQIRRLRGALRIADVVLPLSILSIGQCECFLIGFALNLVLTAWISCELIGVTNRTTTSPCWWTCLQVGSFLVLLPLCGGSGIALVPPVVLWLVVYVACGWWSGRDPGPSGRAVGIVMLMMASSVATWYLVGYARPAHIPPAPSFSAVCHTMLQALSLVVSPSRWGYWYVAGCTVLVLTAATILKLSVVAWRMPLERPRALGLCAMMVALLGVAATVGFSRSGLGQEMGLASRYMTILTPLLYALYVAWLLYGSPAARHAFQIGLLVVVCAGLPAQITLARDLGFARRDFFVQIENGLKNGVPTSRLLDLACPILHPDRAALYGSFKLLEQAQVGDFRFLVDDGLTAEDRGLAAKLDASTIVR